MTISVSLLTIYSISSRAAEICNTVIECRTLQSKVEERLKILEAAPLVLIDNIARYGDGTPVLLSISDAYKFCEEKELQLPTVRELAFFAQNLGAKGNSETGYPEINIKKELVQKEIEEKKKTGWTLILRYKVDDSRAHNQDDNGIEVVDFYYSSLGYKRPTDDSGNYSFWSRSQQGNSDSFLVLDGTNGNFINRRYGNVAAVRCIPKT
jgi:hypothetical protein